MTSINRLGNDRRSMPCSSSSSVQACHPPIPSHPTLSLSPQSDKQVKTQPGHWRPGQVCTGRSVITMKSVVGPSISPAAALTSTPRPLAGMYTYTRHGWPYAIDAPHPSIAIRVCLPPEANATAKPRDSGLFRCHVCRTPPREASSDTFCAEPVALHFTRPTALVHVHLSACLSVCLGMYAAGYHPSIHVVSVLVGVGPGVIPEPLEAAPQPLVQHRLPTDTHQKHAHESHTLPHCGRAGTNVRLAHPSVCTQISTRYHPYSISLLLVNR